MDHRTDRGTRKARRATPARALPHAVGRFIETEIAGGAVLLAAAVVALAWANSPWSDFYGTFWHTPVVVDIGPIHFAEDLHHVVNEGLMTLFFFVVGLEIKREFVRGELNNLRVAALPVCAAIGGMVLPAALYAVVAGGGAAGRGWGVPMATDIAFALGVLALLGSRVPSALKVFVLTLAVVDDVGAILVIAVFYGGSIRVGALGVAVTAVILTALLRAARVDWSPLYVVLAAVAWYAAYQSGVHATIAGVALALVTPTKALAPAATLRRWAQALADEPEGADVRQMTIMARESASPAEYLEAMLHPSVSFFVLPVFALANAGIDLRTVGLGAPGAARVVAGLGAGLVIGKLVGILGGAWLGTRLKLAEIPADVTCRHLAGAGALGGVGFTVSLFIAGLAFESPSLGEAARIGVVASSLAAAVLGSVILLGTGRKQTRRAEAVLSHS